MGVNIVAHRNVLSTCNFKEDNKSDVYYCIRNGTDFCMVAWPFFTVTRDGPLGIKFMVYIIWC